VTTPGESAPDGAWQLGSAFGQGMDEGSVIEATTGQARVNLLEAVTQFGLFRQRQTVTRAELSDGQNSLKGRLDLLSDVSAYGSAVMGYNWEIPHSTWSILPFETQLGPVKGVEVSAPEPGKGFLTLKKGGLWRVDTLLCVEGYSVGVWFSINPLTGFLETHYSYSPIFPTLMLEIVNAQGELISATQFDMVADLTINNPTYLETSNAPRSAAFSKTFVLQNMPDESDPAAPDHWVQVRVAIRYTPIYLGAINATVCKVLGGTKRSALSATRWSRDATHINYADEVPDGGDLG
jgi:hypothetical protein